MDGYSERFNALQGRTRKCLKVHTRKKEQEKIELKSGKAEKESYNKGNLSDKKNQRHR